MRRWPGYVPPSSQPPCLAAFAGCRRGTTSTSSWAAAPTRSSRACGRQRSTDRESTASAGLGTCVQRLLYATTLRMRRQTVDRPLSLAPSPSARGMASTSSWTAAPSRSSGACACTTCGAGTLSTCVQRLSPLLPLRMRRQMVDRPLSLALVPASLGRAAASARGRAGAAEVGAGGAAQGARLVSAAGRLRTPARLAPPRHRGLRRCGRTAMMWRGQQLRPRATA